MNTLQSTRCFQMPTGEGPYVVAILHRGRWHEQRVQLAFDKTCLAAEDAHQRSGLTVQVRDADGDVLYEAGESTLN